MSAGKDKIQGLRPVPGYLDPVGKIMPIQGPEGQLHIIRIVFHQQHIDFKITHGFSLTC